MIAPAAPVVEAIGLVRHFGSIRAVDGVDLRVPAGSVFGLLGPNGAGKTTLIRLLLGLIRPRAGSVHLFGQTLDRNTRAACLARIGALVETPVSYPYLSGLDMLRVVALTADCPADDRIEAALARVGLTESGRRNVAVYSLGMKQRLGLAAALVKDPDLLVLDEPTNGLDPAGTREIRELVRSLAAEGKTILLSSHLLSEVEQVCTDLAILQAGRVIAAGPARELLAGHGRPVVAVRVPPAEIAAARDRLAGLAGVESLAERDGWIEAAAPHALSGPIARELVGAGLTVEEIVRRAPSLESVFLDLTDPYGGAA